MAAEAARDAERAAAEEAEEEAAEAALACVQQLREEASAAARDAADAAARAAAAAAAALAAAHARAAAEAADVAAAHGVFAAAHGEVTDAAHHASVATLRADHERALGLAEAAAAAFRQAHSVSDDEHAAEVAALGGSLAQARAALRKFGKLKALGEAKLKSQRRQIGELTTSLDATTSRAAALHHDLEDPATGERARAARAEAAAAQCQGALAEAAAREADLEVRWPRRSRRRPATFLRVLLTHSPYSLLAVSPSCCRLSSPVAASLRNQPNQPGGARAGEAPL